MSNGIKFEKSFIPPSNFYSYIFFTGRRKVHFLVGEGKELVEEYGLDTNTLVRRAWREKSKFGKDGGWVVEVGDPEPNPADSLDNIGIKESSSAVSIAIKLIFQQFQYSNFFY